jgi:WD40 repeat protein
MAYLALGRGDHAEALALCRESLQLNLASGDRQGIAACLVGVASIQVAQTATLPTAMHPPLLRRAAQLLGAVESMLQTVEGRLLQVDEIAYHQTTDLLRKRLVALDSTVYPTAVAEGRALTVEQAVRHALEEEAISEQTQVNLRKHQPAAEPPVTLAPLYDWGEMPAIDLFVGRADEVAQLTAWLIPASEQGAPLARIISVLGMGGMGKTTLVAQVTKAVTPAFDVVIWRSLLNAPPLAELLQNWLQILSRQTVPVRPEAQDEQLRLLLKHLCQKRCLLVLDNVESIFEAEDAQGRAGVTRPGYGGYDHLFQLVGNSDHHSCLVLTSREQPYALTRLGRQTQVTTGRIRLLTLTGLDLRAGQALLQSNGLDTSTEETALLIESYSGNPLALQITAATIADFFDGDVTAFRQTEGAVFDGIRLVLDQQFARLSPLQRDILIWLALEREAIPLQRLRSNLGPSVSMQQLLEALQALQNRSLLEKRGDGLRLQNVIIEYSTDLLVAQVCQEILDLSTWSFDGGSSLLTSLNPTATFQLLCLNRFALLDPQAQEHVRQSQERLIVAPISRQLMAKWGPQQWAPRCAALLTGLRTLAISPHSYAGGNLLNLMLQSGNPVEDSDFSGLPVRRAYLANRQLPGVNFAQADLTGTVFTDTFSTVRSLAFSPSGHLLAGATSTGEIRLWQVANGQPAAVLTGHFKLVMSVAWSTVENCLASGGEDGTVRLWREPDVANLETDWAATLLYKGPDIVRSLAFHSHQPILASATDDAKIRLWHTTTGQLIATLQGHTAQITTVAFAPDGSWLASCSGDRSVRMWDLTALDLHACDLLLADSYLLYQPADQLGEVWSLAFSSDGTWLAGGDINGLIQLWEMAAIRPQRMTHAEKFAMLTTAQAPRHILPGHQGNIVSLCFDHDSKTLISTGDDDLIRIWDVATAQPRRTLQGHTDVVFCLALHPLRALLASGSADGSVRLWDTVNGLPIRTTVGYVKPFTAVAFGPDSKTLVSASGDHLVRVWHLGDTSADAATCQYTLAGHTNLLWSVAVHPHGSLAASAGEDRIIYLWDIAEGRLLRRLQGHTHLISAIVFHPGGTVLASGSLDQSCSLWDITTGRRLATLRDHQSDRNLHNGVWSVAYSPDGRLLAAGYADGEIVLWDAQQQTIGRRFRGHQDWVRSLAFHPTQPLLASSSNDRTVLLWHLETGQLIAVLPGHTDWVMAVAFSPDGQLLASAGHDRTIRLWSMAERQAAVTLTGHTNGILTLAFSPDGKFLVSGSQDESLRVWEQPHTFPERASQQIYAPGPYAGMNITGVTGISAAQRVALRALGAVEG